MWQDTNSTVRSNNPPVSGTMAAFDAYILPFGEARLQFPSECCLQNSFNTLSITRRCVQPRR